MTMIEARVCHCCTSNDGCGDCPACSVPIKPAQRVPVDALFDQLDGSPAMTRRVVLELRDSGYVWMIGGPTGYESLPATAGPFEKDWCACVGTRGRWAECIVPAAEMNRAYQWMGLLR
jgi:hypothetical protein